MSKETNIDNVAALVDDLDENHAEIKLSFSGEVSFRGDELTFQNSDDKSVITGDEWSRLPLDQRDNYSIQDIERAIAVIGHGYWGSWENFQTTIH